MCLEEIWDKASKKATWNERSSPQSSTPGKPLTELLNALRLEISPLSEARTFSGKNKQYKGSRRWAHVRRTANKQAKAMAMSVQGKLTEKTSTRRGTITLPIVTLNRQALQQKTPENGVNLSTVAWKNTQYWLPSTWTKFRCEQKKKKRNST